ncbi:MAG: calcium-binding protein [Nostoc sp.]|uniref:calcium-binding protein n=1 Tax=Nostoc sp. TaxID=1180 RepID=UPI002FF92B73
MANIIGTNANDTLLGSYEADTINGEAGNDTITGNEGDDTLTGGGGKDQFVYNYNTGIDIITDFSGIGKGVNPSAGVIAEVDTLQFQGAALTARNMLLTQNGKNLEITFENVLDAKVILENFALENLDNLSKSTGASVDLGNIKFDGQTSITDSFDVFNANSTQSTIFNKNTVTFLNDLSNNVSGFDNSDDVINGQGGNDRIDGLSGDDILRGSAGNDTLIGGAGNDTLIGYQGNNALIGDIGEDYLNVDTSTGDNTLNGGIGDDTLNARGTTGNNSLSGGDGNDYLSTSSFPIYSGYSYIASSSNNTLDGGAGNDTLNAESPSGDNLLSGGDGNDYLSTSGTKSDNGQLNFTSEGNNTLDGGAGDDRLYADISTGNNLLSGGDGNDTLSTSGTYTRNSFIVPSSGDNTLNGGAGDDYLYADISTGSNFFSGGDGNDSFFLSPISSYAPVYASLSDSSFVTQTVEGGKGDDLLSFFLSSYYYGDNNSTGGIVTTFNPITNEGTITGGTYKVNYKNIEKLNLSGTDADDNIVGSSGKDTLSTGYGGIDTIDGGEGNDVLFVNYSNATGGITTTFNATTNKGTITAGTYRVSYKNIEQLNISGTADDDNIVGNDGNDTLSTGYSGIDTIDGGKGDDVLFVNYNNPAGGITTTFNATTNQGTITAGTYRVSYKNIEQLNILGTADDDNIIGNDGNDTLSGGYDGNDTIIGGRGNDILTGGNGNDILTGGAGNDKFVYDFFESNYNIGTDIITDFGGIGKGSNPSASVINQLDTLQFIGSGLTAQNLQLTQSGNNLEITFENVANSKVILQNFKLENLDNLPATSSRLAIGNILFDGQTNIADSFDVFDGNSTQTSLFNRNTVTFLNDLDNNITGFDNSDDVINGQGGDDIIDGKSGNDIIRGGAGNDLLIGGAGNDSLIGGDGTDTFGFNNYNEGVDTIYDFNAANELIQVSSAGFGGGLSPGSLQETQFTIGTSATTSSQRFIYDDSTGALFFDEDGSASGFTQVQFAKLSTGLSLTENNFVVV